MTAAPAIAWYQRSDARNVLRQCVANPPVVIESKQTFARTTDVILTYDRQDRRVLRLEDIMCAHLRLSEGCVGKAACQFLEERGTFVSANMAIDAVMDQPMTGRPGDPDYVASLPKIDLELGRSAA